MKTIWRLVGEVSTHSRPKAAGLLRGGLKDVLRVSTHSRPKAAGFSGEVNVPQMLVSTHSRPKAAGTAKQGQGHHR